MFNAGIIQATLTGTFNPAAFAAFNAAMHRSNAVMNSQGAAMAGTASRTSRAIGGIGKAGTIVAGGGVLLLGLAVAKGASEAAKFETAMRNVNTIARVSDGALGSLGKRVLQLSQQTGQAPTDLAEGLYDIVSSGFKADDAIKILNHSSRAASAGMTTTAVSTKAVVAVLNAYGLGADQAGKVSDQLFGIVDRGVISYEELAGQIGDLLPYAPKLKLGMDEIGAAIATITKGGTDAAETMTQIKGVMTQFIKPSDAMAEAISQTGFQSGEALVKAKGLQGALDAVRSTTDGSVTAMRKLFPEMRAISGVLALTGDKAKMAREDLKAMSDVSGKTAAALDEQAKGYEFQKKRFIAALKVAGIQLGEGVLPGLTKGAQDMAAAINELSASGKLKQLGEDVGRVISKFAEMAPAIVDAVSVAADALTFLADAFDAGPQAIAAVTDTLLSALTTVTDALIAIGELSNSLPLIPDVDLTPLYEFNTTLDATRERLQAVADPPPIEIKGDPSKAIAALRRVEGEGVEDKVMKILGKDISAAKKIKEIQKLGIGPKTARILANNADALAKAGTVTQALAGIQDKTVTIRVREILDRGATGAAKGGFTKKPKTPPHNARGRRPGVEEIALVGEGAAKELHVDEQGRARWITEPTLMALAAGDYVIPTESRYAGRALGLMMELFGIHGYAAGKKGKPAKGKKGAAAPKPLPIPNAVKFGAVPADELERSRGDALDAYQKRKKRVHDLDVDIREQRQRVADAKGDRAKSKARAKLRDLERDRREYFAGGGTQKSSLATLKRRYDALHAQVAELTRVNREIERLNTLQETERQRMATAAKTGDGGAWTAARNSRAGILETLRARYQKALDVAKPGTNFTAELEGKLAGIQGDIADAAADVFAPEKTQAQQDAEDAAERLRSSGMTDDERRALEGMEAQQSLAALTPGLDDDRAAAEKVAAFLGSVLGVVQSDPARGGAAVVREIADRVARAQADVLSFVGQGANQNEDLQAQLDQAREQVRVAQSEARINARALTVFQRAGDIGTGPQVVINTLHPGDPAVLAAIAAAAVAGMSQQAARQSPRTWLGL